MAGFYIFHNVGIGLRCFAFGLLLGIGGLYVTVFNAAMLGAVVRLHGQLAARRELLPVRHRPRPVRADGDRALRGGRNAAGLLAGRHARPARGSPRCAGPPSESMSTVWAAVVLFVLAADDRGASSRRRRRPTRSRPAWRSSRALLLLFYFFVLGYPRKR